MDSKKSSQKHSSKKIPYVRTEEGPSCSGKPHHGPNFIFQYRTSFIAVLFSTLLVGCFIMIMVYFNMQADRYVESLQADKEFPYSSRVSLGIDPEMRAAVLEMASDKDMFIPNIPFLENEVEASTRQKRQVNIKNPADCKSRQKECPMILKVVREATETMNSEFEKLKNRLVQLQVLSAEDPNHINYQKIMDCLDCANAISHQQEDGFFDSELPHNDHHQASAPIREVLPYFDNQHSAEDSEQEKSNEVKDQHSNDERVGRGLSQQVSESVTNSSKVLDGSKITEIIRKTTIVEKEQGEANNNENQGFHHRPVDSSNTGDESHVTRNIPTPMAMPTAESIYQHQQQQHQQQQQYSANGGVAGSNNQNIPPGLHPFILPTAETTKYSQQIQITPQAGNPPLIPVCFYNSPPSGAAPQQQQQQSFFAPQGMNQANKFFPLNSPSMAPFNFQSSLPSQFFHSGSAPPPFPSQPSFPAQPPFPSRNAPYYCTYISPSSLPPQALSQMSMSNGFSNSFLGMAKSSKEKDSMLGQQLSDGKTTYDDSDEKYWADYCNGFTCPPPYKKCIRHDQRCDGRVDCIGAEDEIDCPASDDPYYTRLAHQKQAGSVQSMQGSTQSLQGSMQPMQGSAQSMQGSAQLLQGSMQPMQGSAQSIQGSAQSLQGPMQPMQGSMQSLQGSIQPMQESMQSIQGSTQGSIQPMQGSMQSMQGSVQPMQGYMQPMRGSTQSLQGSMQPMQGSVQSMQGFMQPMQGSMKSIQGSVQPMQGSMQSMQGSTQWQQGSMQPIQDSVQSMQGPIQPMQGSMQSIQGSTQPMQGSMQVMQGSMQPVQGYMQSMQGPMQPMQGSLYPMQGHMQMQQNDPRVIQDMTRTIIPYMATTMSPVFDTTDTNEVETTTMKIVVPQLPQQFTCKRIIQTVSLDKRCNGIFDCEDASDEEGCTCRDYLQQQRPFALCDGHVDCDDGTDEQGCNFCSNDQYHCHRSGGCIPRSKVCNQMNDCKLNEDELDCLVLTDGKRLNLDLDGRPHLNLAGVATRYDRGAWRAQCVRPEQHGQNTRTDAGQKICEYLGFSNVDSVSEVVVPTSRLEVKSATSDEPIAYEYPPRFTRMSRGDNNTCYGLYVRCKPVLGRKVNVDLKIDPITKTRNYIWPWEGSVFVDGKYHCPAVLLENDLMLASAKCSENIDLHHNYTTVVFGVSSPDVPYSGPYQQTSQILDIKPIKNSDASLFRLKDGVNMTRYVQPIYMEKKIFPAAPGDSCVALGVNGRGQRKVKFLSPVVDDCPKCHRCYADAKEAPCSRANETINWSGNIVCLSNKGGWYPTAVFQDKDENCGFSRRQTLNSIDYIHAHLSEAIDEPSSRIEVPACEGVRCTFGECIPWNRVCDGVRDCRDGADENPATCSDLNKRCKENIAGCKCSASELRCGNGKCVSKEKFCDGKIDCEDGSDEPASCTCAEYLKLTKPKLVCDNRRHCLDKSDEDPRHCTCKDNSFKCSKSTRNDTMICVSQDVVCDGQPDCPEGEDEADHACMTIKSERFDGHGRGELQRRSYGVWQSVCTPEPVTNLATVQQACVKMGYHSGLLLDNSKQADSVYVARNDFYMFQPNNHTWITLREDESFGTWIPANAPCYKLRVHCI